MAGAYMNAETDICLTSLHVTLLKGHLEVDEILAKRGVDLNKKSNHEAI